MKLCKAFKSFIHYLSPSAFEAFASFDLENEAVPVGNICHSVDNSHDIQMYDLSYKVALRQYNICKGSV